MEKEFKIRQWNFIDIKTKGEEKFILQIEGVVSNDD